MPENVTGFGPPGKSFNPLKTLDQRDFRQSAFPTKKREEPPQRTSQR
jgi:hypothetical protein